MKLTEENYVETAEKAIREICALRNKNGKPVSPVTTSKIRNLLAMTAAIYNDVGLRIAPHVCKCTMYQGELYDMGIGQISYEE